MTVIRKGKLIFGCWLGRHSTLSYNMDFQNMMNWEILHSFLQTGFSNGKKDFIKSKGHQKGGTETFLIFFFDFVAEQFYLLKITWYNF